MFGGNMKAAGKGSSEGNAATVEKNESLRQLENILKGTDVGYAALDREWRYTFVNDNALKILGKQREEVIGKVIWDIYPDIVGTSFEANYRKVMNERMPVSFETFYAPWNIWFNDLNNFCASI
jgi:PAS domain-containing protein